MSEYPKVIRVFACNPIEGYEYIARETALEIIDNYAKTVTEDGLVVVNAIKDIINVICPTAPVKLVVTCKDCKYNGLHTCPIAYIEKQTLQFVNHAPDFWCAKGELKKDGEK